MNFLLRLCALLPCALVLLASSALSHAQLSPGADSSPNATSLLTDPTDSPGLHFLFDLERKFAQTTAEGGGKAFAAWFADDAVSLANNEPPVLGHDAIARKANWQAGEYQLTWTPDGGLMGPGGDMGYTWGHYSGHARDKQGAPLVTTGRYISLWKKQRDGTWKVELDASNEGPALDCCKLP